MPNKNKAKGTQFEYRIMRHLEKDGWTCIRSGSSHFPDIRAYRRTDCGLFEIIAVECKNRIAIPKNPINLLTLEERNEAIKLIDKGLSFVLYYNDKRGRKKGRIEMLEPTKNELLGI